MWKMQWFRVVGLKNLAALRWRSCAGDLISCWQLIAIRILKASTGITCMERKVNWLRGATACNPDFFCASLGTQYFGKLSCFQRKLLGGPLQQRSGTHKLLRRLFTNHQKIKLLSARVHLIFWDSGPPPLHSPLKAFTKSAWHLSPGLFSCGNKGCGAHNATLKSATHRKIPKSPRQAGNV